MEKRRSGNAGAGAFLLGVGAGLLIAALLGSVEVRVSRDTGWWKLSVGLGRK